MNFTTVICEENICVGVDGINELEKKNRVAQLNKKLCYSLNYIF